MPLAAKYPVPADRLALDVIVAVQLTAASLLFPYLFRNVRVSLAVVATAWPFLALGGVLSGLPTDQIAAVVAYVTLWLTGLAALRRALPPWSLPAAAAAVCLVTFGTPMLVYLAADFASIDAGTSDALQLLNSWAMAFPHLSATTEQSLADWRRWVLPIVLVATSGVALFVARRRRQVIHNS